MPGVQASWGGRSFGTERGRGKGALVSRYVGSRGSTLVATRHEPCVGVAVLTGCVCPYSGLTGFP
jgi:hypothetical protein